MRGEILCGLMERNIEDTATVPCLEELAIEIYHDESVHFICDKHGSVSRSQITSYAEQINKLFEKLAKAGL